jgi:hypothetical protein
MTGGIMPKKAAYLTALLCVPAAAALIANAPIAAADDTGSSSVAPTDNLDAPPAAFDDTNTLPVCFPPNDVRTAATAADVQSACG